jgi:acetyl-CoA acetyltransferase
MSADVAIIGIGETPYSRARADRGEVVMSAEQYASWAVSLALEDAGLSKGDLDGQGLAVAGTEWPHSEIWSAEVVQNLGFRPKLLLRGDFGGNNAVELAVQAAAAIRSGLVDYVLLLGADSPMTPFGTQTARSWRYDIDYMRPFGLMGFVTLAGLMMSRHMSAYGTKAEHFGKIAVTQREHARLNPNAYVKAPLTMEDYLKSRMLSDPLRLLDSVMFVNGGLAVIMTSRERASRAPKRPIYLLGYGLAHNYAEGDPAMPDITTTGVKVAARDALGMAGKSPGSLDFLQLYDDFTGAVLMQIEDIGFCAKGEGGRFLEGTDISYKGDLPVNTGGGLLSNGQPGMAAGFVHLVEAVRQLRGEATGRQVSDAKMGLVSGLGGLAYGNNLANAGALVLGVMRDVGEAAREAPARGDAAQQAVLGRRGPPRVRGPALPEVRPLHMVSPGVLPLLRLARPRVDEAEGDRHRLRVHDSQGGGGELASLGEGDALRRGDSRHGRRLQDLRPRPGDQAGGRAPRPARAHRLRGPGERRGGAGVPPAGASSRSVNHSFYIPLLSLVKINGQYIGVHRCQCPLLAPQGGGGVPR